MGNKRELLIPGGYYHLYNRAVAEEALFQQQGDYGRFLDTYKKYIEPLADTYCYCLMPNHFHSLIKIKDEIDIIRRVNTDLNSEYVPKVLANEFGKGFNSFAKYYNLKYKRKGSLFIHTFNRKPVNSLQYLNILVCYIHANPYNAGLCQQLEDWKYSSYKHYFRDTSSKINLKTQETLSWFDSKENFIFVHNDFIKSNPEG